MVNGTGRAALREVEEEIVGEIRAEEKSPDDPFHYSTGSWDEIVN